MKRRCMGWMSRSARCSTRVIKWDDYKDEVRIPPHPHLAHTHLLCACVSHARTQCLQDHAAAL